VYNYLQVAAPTYYEANDTTNLASAYFTYCMNLGLTPLQNGCEGAYYATIQLADGTCALNAANVELMSYDP